MLGFKYIKAAPTAYIILHRRGRVVREGAGLSFLYFKPTAEISKVPLNTTDVPFVFGEMTADYQDVAVQGEVTYRIKDPRRLAELMDYSIDGSGRYFSDDPDKTRDRVTHAAQIITRSFAQRFRLRELLVKSDQMVSELTTGLRQSESVTMLGLEILGVSILGIKPSPDMVKALQAEAREQMLRKADEAVYERRNAAVELERTIKENELNTEIAVEQKKKIVRETQVQGEVAVEQKRKELIDHRVTNERKEHQARVEALKGVLDQVRDVDWRTLMAVSGQGLDAKAMIAMAFRDLADNAQKIGNLTISSELLETLLKKTTSNTRTDR